MAKFELTLPNDIIKQFDQMEKSTEKMLEEMVEAGAKTVVDRIKTGVPASWHGSDIMNCLKVTNPYKTPSDDGINVKVGFYGTFRGRDGREHIAPLVGNVTEYGRKSSKYPKHPFLRKSFNKEDIEAAMLRVQKKYIEE